MKTGDRVQIIESIDPSNPIDPMYIGATATVIKPGDGLTVAGMVSVRHDRGGIDAYWPEELELQ